jgi:peptidoglycan LD-endopeptidase LytH
MMQSEFSKIISNNNYTFYPVVPFDSNTDTLTALDLSVGNKRLTPEIVNNINLFSALIEDHIAGAGARYAVGGYAEHRMIYGFSDLFDGPDASNEPRRFHLGTDIWSEAGTPVIAPLQGTIHSFAFNNQKGDYGGTIILEHKFEQFSFFTLYGHLSKKSLEQIEEGVVLKGGKVFAEIGRPEENGEWPPHLHFQVILNLNGYKGDYPGVCRFSEREKWLENCPDSDLILDFDRHLAGFS